MIDSQMPNYTRQKYWTIRTNIAETPTKTRFISRAPFAVTRKVACEVHVAKLACLGVIKYSKFCKIERLAYEDKCMVIVLGRLTCMQVERQKH